MKYWIAATLVFIVFFAAGQTTVGPSGMVGVSQSGGGAASPTANPNPWTTQTVLSGNGSGTPNITGVTIDGSNNINTNGNITATAGVMTAYTQFLTLAGGSFSWQNRGVLASPVDGFFLYHDTQQLRIQKPKW